MAAAAVAFLMMVAVMIALNIGVEIQLSFQEGPDSGIRIAGHAAVQLDSGRCQRHLGTAADAAADQNFCLQSSQETGQSAMAAAVGVHHLGRNNSTILYIIDLKLLGVTKVLKDLSVRISNCNSHILSS